MPDKLRAVFYLRVSKRDSKQNPENQALQMRQLIASQPDWKLTHEYIDKDTGSKPDRDQFQTMLSDAEDRRFDILVFWSLDRFSREGVLPTLNTLQRLERLGVGWRSFTEQYLDTCGIWKDAVIGILATVAKFERLRISERVKAGIERRRAQGLPVGGQETVIDMDYFERAVKVYTNAELARVFRCSLTTIKKTKNKLRMRLSKVS